MTKLGLVPSAAHAHLSQPRRSAGPPEPVRLAHAHGRASGASPTDPDLVRLLAGPYAPPPLRKGDRATCLYRDADVVGTSWSDARISSPRCRALGVRGGSGLLVNEELLRAVRTESAQALTYWFGIGEHAIWSWRRAFGVSQWGREGSRRLHQQTSEKAAAVLRERGLTDAQCDAMSGRSKRLNLARFLREHSPRPLWTKAQLKMLGTMPDADLAAKIGRTVEADRAGDQDLPGPDAEGKLSSAPAGPALKLQFVRHEHVFLLVSV